MKLRPGGTHVDNMYTPVLCMDTPLRKPKSSKPDKHRIRKIVNWGTNEDLEMT